MITFNFERVTWGAGDRAGRVDEGALRGLVITSENNRPRGVSSQ